MTLRSRVDSLSRRQVVGIIGVAALVILGAATLAAVVRHQGSGPAAHRQDPPTSSSSSSSSSASSLGQTLPTSHGNGAPSPGPLAGSPQPLRLDRPFVPLFTEVARCDAVRAFVQTSPQDQAAHIRDLATWYVHVHAESSNQFLLGKDCGASAGPTAAQQLANVGVWVSNYRNGSYVSQARMGDVNANEAVDLEQ
ncbi:MAG: hypothetical protein LC799_18295, partial [Actinobacteria bacterium]|nr:hypothetical protein [Actinomycetota bacterium]